MFCQGFPCCVPSLSSQLGGHACLCIYCSHVLLMFLATRGNRYFGAPAIRLKRTAEFIRRHDKRKAAVQAARKKKNRDGVLRLIQVNDMYF